MLDSLLTAAASAESSQASAEGRVIDLRFTTSYQQPKLIAIDKQPFGFIATLCDASVCACFPKLIKIAVFSNQSVALHPLATGRPPMTLDDLCAHLLPPDQQLKFQTLIIDEPRLILAPI